MHDRFTGLGNTESIKPCRGLKQTETNNMSKTKSTSEQLHKYQKLNKFKNLLLPVCQHENWGEGKEETSGKRSQRYSAVNTGGTSALQLPRKAMRSARRLLCNPEAQSTSHYADVRILNLRN